MSKLLLILTIFISNVSYACFAPIGGPEYDAQIEIQKLDEKNSYRVTVPRYMKDMPNEAQIILAYSTGHAGGIPVYEKKRNFKTYHQWQ